jgi:hypothetical protein
MADRSATDQSSGVVRALVAAWNQHDAGAFAAALAADAEWTDVVGQAAYGRQVMGGAAPPALFPLLPPRQARRHRSPGSAAAAGRHLDRLPLGDDRPPLADR